MDSHQSHRELLLAAESSEDSEPSNSAEERRVRFADKGKKTASKDSTNSEAPSPTLSDVTLQDTLPLKPSIHASTSASPVPANSDENCEEKVEEGTSERKEDPPTATTTIVITPTTTSITTTKDGKTTTQTTLRTVVNTTTSAPLPVIPSSSSSVVPTDPEKEQWNPHTMPVRTLNLTNVSTEDANAIAALLAAEVNEEEQIGSPPRYHTIAYDPAYHKRLFVLYRGRLRRTYLWPIFVPSAAIILMFFASPPSNRVYTIIPLVLWAAIIIIMLFIYRRKSKRLEKIYKLGMLATIPFNELNAVVLYNAPISETPEYDEMAIRFDDPLPLYPLTRTASMNSRASRRSRTSVISRVNDFFIGADHPSMPPDAAIIQRSLRRPRVGSIPDVTRNLDASGSSPISETTIPVPSLPTVPPSIVVRQPLTG
ncbi:hypothetical protein HK096_010609 [Nowakowskiella sp. JEL0078]|nr:hypothetical protein HK096_010609 [Nowakowskiella sp. JEL0078]